MFKELIEKVRVESQIQAAKSPVDVWGKRRLRIRFISKAFMSWCKPRSRLLPALFWSETCVAGIHYEVFVVRINHRDRWHKFYVNEVFGMSRGLNKVMIIGRIGREPEMRYTPSGKPVTTFSVATNRSWNTSDGERHSETEWFNVVAWGSLAEICKQHLTKNQQVYIEVASIPSLGR
jgi:primosomal replication protein N